MSKEMKVGLVLILTLLGVFGTVAYKKLAPNEQFFAKLTGHPQAKSPNNEDEPGGSTDAISAVNTEPFQLHTTLQTEAAAPLIEENTEDGFYQSASTAESSQQNSPADPFTVETRQSSTWDLTISPRGLQTTQTVPDNSSSDAAAATPPRSNNHMNPGKSTQPATAAFFDTQEVQQTNLQVAQAREHPSPSGNTLSSKPSTASNDKEDSFFMNLSADSSENPAAKELRLTDPIEDLGKTSGERPAATQLDHSSTERPQSSTDPFVATANSDDGDFENRRPHPSPEAAASNQSISLEFSDSHQERAVETTRTLPETHSQVPDISSSRFGEQEAANTPNDGERLNGFRKANVKQRRLDSLQEPGLETRLPTPQLTTQQLENGPPSDIPAQNRPTAPWNNSLERQTEPEVFGNDSTIQQPQQANGPLGQIEEVPKTLRHRFSTQISSHQAPLAGSTGFEDHLDQASNSVDSGFSKPSGVREYVVQSDDSYWTISKKQYGTGRYYRGLAMYNERMVADPRQLRPGLRIKTPSKTVLESAFPQLFPQPGPVQPVVRRSEGTASGGDANRYVVEENDNFWKISKKRYGTGRYYKALARHNRQLVPDPLRMRPGLLVLTPAQDVLDSLYPDLLAGTPLAKNPLPSYDQSGFFRDANGEPMFRVGSTDTLTSVAQSHLGRSSRWKQIYQMNKDRLKNPNRLNIGTILRLPGDASRVKLVQKPAGFR